MLDSPHLQGRMDNPDFRLQGNLFSKIHHIIHKVKCRIQVVQQQMCQDGEIRDLAERLQDTLAFANECSDLHQIRGGTDIIKEIIRAVLEAASLIDEYAQLPFAGRYFCISNPGLPLTYIFFSQEGLFAVSPQWISWIVSNHAKVAYPS